VDEERRRYLSYLLRLWQAQREDKLVWRASLETARTGEQTGFASLKELFAFLREQTGTAPEQGPGGKSREDESQPEKGALT
jgi:hypothetical protein